MLEQIACESECEELREKAEECIEFFFMDEDAIDDESYFFLDQILSEGQPRADANGVEIKQGAAAAAGGQDNESSTA